MPLLNEADSLPELCDWIDRVCLEHGIRREIIFVDDGSTDDSWKVIQDLSSRYPNVRALRFRRNHGKSAALNQGFEHCSGAVVVTMDADLQDSPDELPDLIRMVREEGFDMVSGWKKKRYDPISKTIPTKLFNWAARRMSGIELHDFNCGLKAYKLEVVKNVEVQGEMHRYIPILAKNAGFKRIGEKVVQHRARKYGSSKFGWERFVNGYLDLFTLAFIGRFAKRPMHFFGLYGSLMFVLGFCSAAWIGGSKLYRMSQGIRSIRVTDDPWFYIALTSMVLGTTLFVTGFIAELIVRSGGKRSAYAISETLNLDRGDEV